MRVWVFERSTTCMNRLHDYQPLQSRKFRPTSYNISAPRHFCTRMLKNCRHSWSPGYWRGVSTTVSLRAQTEEVGMVPGVPAKSHLSEQDFFLLLENKKIETKNVQLSIKKTFTEVYSNIGGNIRLVQNNRQLCLITLKMYL